MSGETGVDRRDSMTVTVEMAMLMKEWEEKKARSSEVGKVLEDLKLHKLRMKRLAEELSVAEAWETELKTRRLRVEESLKPPLLGLLTSWRRSSLLVIGFCKRHLQVVAKMCLRSWKIGQVE